MWQNLVFHAADSLFHGSTSQPLSTAHYFAELKSFVNNTLVLLIAEATSPPLHGGRKQHIHLTGKKKVGSQQFLSESADSTDRVKQQPRQWRPKPFTMRSNTGEVKKKHSCNAGLTFTQVVFQLRF